VTTTSHGSWPRKRRSLSPSWSRGTSPACAPGSPGLSWRQVPVAHDAREKGHGRAERRILKVTAVAAGLAFPHAAQALQIIRRRRPLTGNKWSTQTIYAITSLAATQACPAELAAIARGHWVIEDRLHWVRSPGVLGLWHDVAPDAPTEGFCNTFPWV
jgi:hypothetical protein